MESDAELLRRFADEKDQAAFTTVVRRHLDLVHSAALRRTGGRSDLAQDISQRVFCGLARKAASLVHHPVLTAWLYQATRFAAADVLRAEHRHCRNREPWEAAMKTPPQDSQETVWRDVQNELDDALDELRKHDQQLILLRFFRGHSYREISVQLNITENAARMRAERALDTLRRLLARRGVTCASALLGSVLTSQAVTATPSAVLTAVSSTAAAITPAPVGFASALLMSKLTPPIATAIIASAATVMLWTSIAPSAEGQIASLRAERERLQAAAASAPNAAAVSAARDQFRAQASSILAAFNTAHGAAIGRAPQGSAAATRSTSRHANRGTATPHDAIMTFTWASDSADIPALSKLIYFDEDGRALASEVLANLPANLRMQYATPEELYAFLLAADAVLVPPPGPDVLENLSPAEIRPGRVSMRRPGAKRGRHEMQLTAEGWKWVFPTHAIQPFANQILSSETLLQLQAK